MKVQGTSALSGSNGEPDDGSLTVAERLRRWQTTAATERVGGFEYSLWKNPALLPSPVPRFSRVFVVGLPLGVIVLLGLARWVLDRTRVGDFLPMRVFPSASSRWSTSALLASSWPEREKPRPIEGDAMAPPEGVPKRAVAAYVRVAQRGSCLGWLWFDRDAMCFRGLGFDFRLRREDLVNKGQAIKALRRQDGTPLRHPKGITAHRLQVFPGVIVGDTFQADPRLWSGLESEAAAWESGSFTTEPSLFPPVRPVPTAKPVLGWREWIGPPLFMGLILGITEILFPLLPSPGRPGSPPFAFPLAGAAYGLMWPLPPPHRRGDGTVDEQRG